jgi:hypothetical protein
LNRYSRHVFALFTLALILFINTEINAQKKGIPIVSDILQYFTTPISDDSLTFYRANGFYEMRLRKVINGVYFSGGMINDKISSNLINRSVFVPYYTQNPELSFNPITTKVILSPISFSFGFYNAEQDMSKLKLNFATPPVPPGASVLDTKLKLSYVEASFNYIPFSIFWGYVYPEVGLKINHLTTSFNTKKTYLVNIGLNSSVMFKFKNLFINIEYTKFFNNSKYIKDKLNIGGGIFLGWM